MANDRASPENLLPSRLGHKPLYAIPYAAHDGKFAGETDARFLTLGLAQWDPGKELSVKVLRLSGGRWSRHSEELPLHRPIDLTIFLALVLFRRAKQIPPHTFWNQPEPLNIEEISPPSIPYGKIRSIEDFLDKNQAEVDLLKDRLRALCNVLNGLKEEGII